MNEYRSIPIMQSGRDFFPELAWEIFSRACEWKKVEFTLSQCVICYDMSLITLLSHLLGAFEGFQNYNLININTKHASYKTGSRKKNHFKCHRAFNTCASKNFRLAQGSLAIRFWIERKPYVKRYFNANYVIFIHWEQCNSIQNLIAKLPIKIELPSLQCKSIVQWRLIPAFL